MELIDLSPVEKVVVTDSVPLPKDCSSKIAQVRVRVRVRVSRKGGGDRQCALT
jgi:hypothetical protein